MNLFIFFGTSYFQSVIFEPENMLKQTVGNTADIFLPVGYQKLRHFQDNIVSLGKNFIDNFIKLGIQSRAYDNTTSNTTETPMTVVFNCTNYGGKIELDVQTKEVALLVIQVYNNLF